MRCFWVQVMSRNGYGAGGRGSAEAAKGAAKGGREERRLSFVDASAADISAAMRSHSALVH